MMIPDPTTHKLVTDAATFELMIVGKEGVWRRAIPTDGELVVGRVVESDVQLASPSVSRRHAILRVHGSAFSVEDLGSANGTIVGGRRLTPSQPTAVVTGEAMQLGEYVLMFQPQRQAGRARHVWTLDYFEARLVEQCAKVGQGSAPPFHVLRVRADAGADHAVLAIAAEISPGDVIARLSAGVWAVLFVDGGEAKAMLAQVERSLASAGVTATSSLLCFPRDVTSPGALMARLWDPSVDDVQAMPDVVLQDERMQALYRQLEPIARGELTVLILGETGVGKDVLARRLHDGSPRRGGAFLRINCAAISETLLESEMFGHERGAFTGALGAKAGLLETASGGTVFLDEIGELPLSLQPKLLQVLERREVTRIGSVKPRNVDVRFVAATNRDLEQEVASGRFRADLYFRLAGYSVDIPPLRERRDDILPLAKAFLRRHRAKPGPRDVELSNEVIELLLAYPWPGNVRELRNLIDRAVAVSEGRPLTIEHLPVDKMRTVVLVGQSRAVPDDAADDGDSPAETGLTKTELAERQRLIDALETTNGNQSKAAELLGWSRSTLINRLNLYRLRPRRRGR